MTRGSAADFLIRTVLDEAFRELALAEPQRAFEEYDLSAEEKKILSSPDDRLLGLLGAASVRGEAADEHPPKKAVSKPAAAPLPRLPEVKLLLRLAPHAAQLPDSKSRVAYTASLHPWPHDRAPKSTDAESDEQSAGHDDGPPPEIAWIVRIKPTVIDAQETGLKVAYTASIHPLDADTGEEQPSAPGPTPAVASPPWNHHIESSAAQAAARAVLESDARQRYEKLLGLIHALQTGDERV